MHGLQSQQRYGHYFMNPSKPGVLHACVNSEYLQRRKGWLGTELGLQQLLVWHHQPLQAKWLVWIAWFLGAYCNQTLPRKRKHHCGNVYIVIAMVTTLK